MRATNPARPPHRANAESPIDRNKRPIDRIVVILSSALQQSGAVFIWNIAIIAKRSESPRKQRHKYSNERTKKAHLTREVGVGVKFNAV
jgi:hypothetical protein